MFDEALSALADSATLVTPTRRLSAAIRRAYDSRQHAQGRQTWRSPDILPWSAWQQRQWHAAQLTAELPLLLNPQQELALWERVIDESPESGAMLQTDAAAHAAAEAWAMTCAWRLAASLRGGPVGEEARAFLGWSERYTRFCARRSLIDSARLPDELARLIREGIVAAPARLVFYGFDAIDPQRENLIAALRERGARVETLLIARAPREAVLISHPGPEQEIQAAARWARSLLLRDAQTRIGVVVPELARLRSTIARVFDDALLPGALLAPGELQPRPWNLSLGLPLSHWPPVHAAQLLLELAAGHLPAAAAGVLLRSPFLGGAESERSARALLDAKLCRVGEPRVTLDGLAYVAAQESRLHACPLLLERLRKVRHRARALLQQRCGPSAWSPLLQSLLSAAGWPGERGLNSEEYQAVEAWRDLLGGLAHLDLIHGELAFNGALDLLRRQAGERLFQPETPEVPVQILGVLESVGLEFDHLMVVGLHADAWPRPARPNPLLPVELQRRAGVPAGSPDWELAFARRMTEWWRGAAPAVVFSHPCGDGDQEFGVSPLLVDTRPATAEDLQIEPCEDYRLQVYAARSLEVVEDVEVRALPAGIALAGGAGLLQDQSACPFRAFAAHRLGATVIEQPAEGLDAGERGSLLHAVLATLWSQLRSSAELHRLDHDTLRDRVRAAVDAALPRWMRRRPSAFQTRFLELERTRLQALAHEWLEVEKGRAPFEVAQVEQTRALEAGGVRLEVRLDRVDRLADGDELLIDYKTGKASVSHWLGERPEEPQLPAYACTGERTPAGLAFARVKRGESGLEGLAERPEFGSGIQAVAAAKLKGAAADWPGQLAAWDAMLAALGAQFRAGEARVDPKRYPQTCSHCGFSSLCRVQELRDADPETTAEDE